MHKYFLEENGKLYYYGYGSGQLKYGWSTIGEDRYYSNTKGEIQIGHKTIDGAKYYFENDGKMHRYFLEENDKLYYYGYGSGQLKYGWSTIGKDKYYSNTKGEILIGHQEIDGAKYYFENDGKMHRYFLEENGKLYYYGYGSGQLKYGWSIIGEDKYYSNSDGEILTGTNTINGIEYIFKEDGKLFQGFEDTENGKVFHSTETGQIVKGLIKYKNEVYYADENGIIQSGEIIVDDKKYIFTEDGPAYKGFYEDSEGDIYYYDQNDAYLRQGWFIILNDVYYADSTGKILTGNATIENDNYNFNNEGKLIKKQTRPVYYMQTDSRWATIKYGSRTLKATGCAPTSMAMAFSAIKNTTILPTDVANYLYYDTQEYNRYTIGASGLAIVYATSKYGIRRTPIYTEEEMKLALARGYIVFAAMGNGKFATPNWNHAIILFDYNNGNTIAYDPLKSENNGWVSIKQLFYEQSKDPDDSRGGSNFYMLG